ncbi:hypothetical protein HJG60_010071 [Phyllostomus discolor]|uniref:Uncharacterized protein n=1 Tax=Phyllostomus discolor TaxID=89673 RepID=A0A834B104_9CHIR|nr:hypothetical protein HJG60_010071 [Phyllostomus discolor]
MGECRVGAQEIPPQTHTQSTTHTEHGPRGDALPAGPRVRVWAGAPGSLSRKRLGKQTRMIPRFVQRRPRTRSPFLTTHCTPDPRGSFQRQSPSGPLRRHLVGFGHCPSPHWSAHRDPGLYSTSKAGWWVPLFCALRTGARMRVRQLRLARSAWQVGTMNSCRRRSSARPRGTSTSPRVFIADGKLAGHPLA